MTIDHFFLFCDRLIIEPLFSTDSPMFSQGDFVQSRDVRRRFFSGGGSGSSSSFLQDCDEKNNQKKVNEIFPLLHTDWTDRGSLVCAKKITKYVNHVWVPLDSILDYINFGQRKQNNISAAEPAKMSERLVFVLTFHWATSFNVN